LYNSLTQKIEPFHVAQNKQVKMYTCGPSTYQRPHIGNYRTFLFEDILQRYLEYLGYSVTRLITLTNIEDKAVDWAEIANITVEELTSRNEEIFFEEFEQLRIKRPQFTVRASTIVDQAVKLIQTLLTKGVAYKYTYRGAHNVYFDPLKFEGFGKLARLDMKKWPKTRHRFHLDTYPGMPWHLGDFVLWRGCHAHERVCWDTELGRGRPAWNVQDAAMVTEHLGFSIDIACGGVDNLVRHHDYTLAVAEAASGEPFARFWLHGGHLYVDGKKMSKSQGNVLYLDELVAKDYYGAAVRFFLIYGAYRKKLNFTWEALAESSRKLDNCQALIRELQNNQTANAPSTNQAKKAVQNLLPTFEKHMNNDLDAKSAFDAVYATVALLVEFKRKKALGKAELDAAIDALRRIDSVLQVLF
jgi:cysteinyl-tRNA synthetase